MSPLVRAWLAARLTDWADHAYACWRAITHSLGITLEWDPLELGDEYKLPAPVNADTVAAGQPGTAVPTPPSPALNLDLPGPAGARVTAASKSSGAVIPTAGADGHLYPLEMARAAVGRAGEPTFNTMLPCDTCGAHSNAPCVNRYGETTGPHKARRDAAAAAATLGGTS